MGSPFLSDGSADELHVTCDQDKASTFESFSRLSQKRNYHTCLHTKLILRCTSCGGTVFLSLEYK